MEKEKLPMPRTNLSRTKFRAALAMFSFLTAACAWGQTGPTAKPATAFARAAKLKRGINASEWFAQVYDKRGYTAEHFQTWTTPEDIALIKAMGFDHVRLSVNPEPMFNSREPEKMPADYVASLDTAVKLILDHGLAVVI